MDGDFDIEMVVKEELKSVEDPIVVDEAGFTVSDDEEESQDSSKEE